MTRKFIIKNPFVTKQRKKSSKLYLDMARVYREAVRRSRSRTDVSPDEIEYYDQQARHYEQMAAHFNGFRNYRDMQLYFSCDSRLP